MTSPLGKHVLRGHVRGPIFFYATKKFPFLICKFRPEVTIETSICTCSPQALNLIASSCHL